MSITLILMMGPLLVQPLHARNTSHGSRSADAPTVERRGKSGKDQRDRADRALDKKIKSICRGC